MEVLHEALGEAAAGRKVQGLGCNVDEVLGRGRGGCVGLLLGEDVGERVEEARAPGSFSFSFLLGQPVCCS